MTEERKYAILIAATILSARRIQESILSDKPDMAKQFYVDRAIQEAAFILERIDKKFPPAGCVKGTGTGRRSPRIETCSFARSREWAD
jgi:hypothetical protein